MDYVVLLCDRNGIAIDHLGKQSLPDQFKHWGTWLGGVWAEDVEGMKEISRHRLLFRPEVAGFLWRTILDRMRDKWRGHPPISGELDDARS